MKKKMIVGISLGLSAALIALFLIWGILISSRTKEAREAAEGFVSLLQDAELERLRVEYYMVSGEEAKVFRNENGQVTGQIISNQQAAEIFGVETIMELFEMDENGDEEGSAADTIGEEALLKLLMKHAQIAGHVGTVLGKSGSMNLQMMMPDLKTWLLECPEDELQTLNAIESREDFLAELDRKMEAEEIGLCYVQLRIPMKKQNGKWRFEVSEETEQQFFGGMYSF